MATRGDTPISFPPGGGGRRGQTESTSRLTETPPPLQLLHNQSYTHNDKAISSHRPTSPPSSTGLGWFPVRCRGTRGSPAPSYPSRPLHRVCALVCAINHSIYSEASVPSFFHVSSPSARHFGGSPSTPALRLPDRGDWLPDLFSIIGGSPEHPSASKSCAGG